MVADIRWLMGEIDEELSQATAIPNDAGGGRSRGQRSSVSVNVTGGIALAPERGEQARSHSIELDWQGGGAQSAAADVATPQAVCEGSSLAERKKSLTFFYFLKALRQEYRHQHHQPQHQYRHFADAGSGLSSLLGGGGVDHVAAEARTSAGPEASSGMSLGADTAALALPQAVDGLVFPEVAGAGVDVGGELEGGAAALPSSLSGAAWTKAHQEVRNLEQRAQELRLSAQDASCQGEEAADGVGKVLVFRQAGAKVGAASLGRKT